MENRVKVRKITDGKNDALGFTNVNDNAGLSSDLYIMSGPVLSDEGEDGTLSRQTCNVII